MADPEGAIPDDNPAAGGLRRGAEPPGNHPGADGMIADNNAADEEAREPNIDNNGHQDDSSDEEEESELSQGANMVLTDRERFLANQLKTAAKAGLPEADVRKVSDIEFAQHAMSVLGNLNVYQGVDPITGMADPATVQIVLNNITKLEVFRREYHVRDTLEEATETIQIYMDTRPGSILYLAYDPRPQDDAVRRAAAEAAGQPPPAPRAGCVLVIDFRAIDVATALGRSEDEWRTLIVARYYLMHAMFPHIAAMRAGFLFIMELEGLGFETQAQQIAFLRRGSDELMCCYPAHYKSIQGYHSPLVANLVFSMANHFFSQTSRHRIQMGLRMDEETASQYDRLSDLFGTNTPQIILRNATELLEKRFENQQWFSLDG